MKEFSQLKAEWRVLKMCEFLAVRVGFCHHLVLDVKLKVIAVRADHGAIESDGFVSACPMEYGFEADLFARIALRFVKSRRWLGLVIDVSYSVITDSISRPEIVMCVVVE